MTALSRGRAQYMQPCRNASLVGLSPLMRVPSGDNSDKRAGSNLPSETLVGIARMDPSDRRR
jgi:hypothetical protein